MFSLGPACACLHLVADHDDLGCTIISPTGRVCDCLVDFEQEPDAA